MSGRHTTSYSTHPNHQAGRILQKRQYRHLQARTESPNLNSLSGAGSDQMRHDYDSSRNLSLDSLCTGYITGYFPYDGIYTVQLAERKIAVACVDSHGRGLPLSTSRAAAYPPGSRVVVYYRGTEDVSVPSIILGSIPDLADSNRLFSDNTLYTSVNHLHSRIGPRKDLFPDAYSVSYSGHYFGDAQPTDSTCLGDLTFSNFMGGLLHINMWQAILRTSNGCGIWMNFIDELARYVSKNLQIWTPAGQINKYTNGCETYNYSGQALYDWEGLGMLRMPSKKKEWMSVDNERATDLETLQTTAEPVEPNMSPFFRFEQFNGWFGHGGMVGVKSLPEDRPDIFDSRKPLTTSQLFRQTINASGVYTLQSYGGFGFERALSIPCYQSIREQFENDSDGLDEEYQFGGDSEDEVSTLQIDPEETDKRIPDNIVKMLGVIDYFIREKYKSLYAFIKHKKDYQRVDSFRELKPDSLQPYVSALQTQQFMPSLATVSVKAELFATDEVDFVMRAAGFYFTPDGGILIQDSYGNEIRTGANGIEINSVSDITQTAHRRMVSMSGDDMILTANKSMDLTAVQNDIRVQAYNNTEITGGISGKGRTLIENRGVGEFDAWVDEEDVGEDIETTGLYLISKNASTIHYTDSIFTKCTNSAYYDYTKCWNYAADTYEVKAQAYMAALIGTKEERDSSSGVVLEPGKAACLGELNVKDHVTAEKSLNVNGNLILDGNILGGGYIRVGGNVCCKQVSEESDCEVAETQDDGTTVDVPVGVYAKNAIQKMMGRYSGITEQEADKLYEDAIQHYDDEKVGHQATIDNVFVSGRNQEQYGTKEYFFIMPDYVNEIDKSSGVSGFALSGFYEKFDKDDIGLEGPFPGKTRWEEECCIVPKSVFSYNDGTTVRANDIYDIDTHNGIKYYVKPELTTPDKVFSAVVIS